MTKKTVELGFFLTFALILSYVESLIPFSFGIPGIKLGLPNLIVVLLLCRGTEEKNRSGRQRFARCADALLVNVLRIILSGFLFSGMYTVLYALAGAFFSFAAMLTGRWTRWFSVLGISVLGGVFHNIGQILVAMFVVETVYVGYYIPFLIVSGTVTGAVLGIAALEVIPYLRRHENRGED